MSFTPRATRASLKAGGTEETPKQATPATPATPNTNTKGKRKRGNRGKGNKTPVKTAAQKKLNEPEPSDDLEIELEEDEMGEMEAQLQQEMESMDDEGNEEDQEEQEEEVEEVEEEKKKGKEKSDSPKKDDPMDELIVLDEVKLDEGGGYDDGEGQFGPRAGSKAKEGIKNRIGRKEELFPKKVKLYWVNKIAKMTTLDVIGCEYIVEIQDAKSGPNAPPAYHCFLTDKFISNQQPAGKPTSFDLLMKHLRSAERIKAYLARHMPTVLSELPTSKSAVDPERLPQVIAFIHGKTVEEVSKDDKLMSVPKGTHHLMAQFARKMSGMGKVHLVVGRGLFAKMKQEVKKVCEKADHFK